jgi:hypothetical protein
VDAGTHDQATHAVSEQADGLIALFQQTKRNACNTSLRLRAARVDGN